MAENYGVNLVTSNLMTLYDPVNYFSYSGTGSTIIDVSGKNYNGTLNNVSVDTSLLSLGILSFNGSTSYITGNNYSPITVSSSITINAWVYCNSLQNCSIFNNYSLGLSTAYTQPTNGYPSVGKYNSSGGTITAPASPSVIAGFLGFSTTAAGASVISVNDNRNGAYTIVAQTSGFQTAMNHYFYGCIFYGVNTSTLSIAVSNTLSVSGVANNFINVYEIVGVNTASPLVGFAITTWYKSTGPTYTQNFSTVGTSIIYACGMTSASSGLSMPATASGTLYTGTGGNGVQYGIEAGTIATSVGVTSTRFTWSITNQTWFGIGGAMSFNPLSSYTAPNQNSGLVISNTGSINARTRTADYSTNASISANAWYNVSMVYTSAGCSSYINGVFISNIPGATLSASTGITSIALGSNGITASSELLNGYIGYLSVYSSGLTSNQITQNFNALRGRFNI